MPSLTVSGSLGFLTGCFSYLSLNLNQGWESSIAETLSRVLANLNLPLLSLQIALLVFLSRSKKHSVITITGFFLGLGFLLGVLNYQCSFGIYIAVLTFFHFSEFLVTGLTNPQNLSFDSYLVNHSVQYGVAALFSWIEHGVTLYLFPGFKSIKAITLAGLAICIVGEILRKLAMFHAGRNFNHLVQDRKSEEHVLVTSGIYGWFRHPSYVGWFLWSVGSQIILINPLCCVAYTVVSYSFFKERIYVEEYTLVMFFQDEYRMYQKRVGTGLPGINGFTLPRD